MGNNIENDKIFIKARDRAYKYLAHSARTYAETYGKLKNEQYPEEIIREVMELLECYNYIDDKAYAEEYVRIKAEYKGYGRKRIEYELKGKGVNSGIVESALEQYPCDETESAVSQIRKKLRGGEIADNKDRKKIFGYLLRRGFSYDVASKAVKKYEYENEFESNLEDVEFFEE